MIPKYHQKSTFSISKGSVDGLSGLRDLIQNNRLIIEPNAQTPNIICIEFLGPSSNICVITKIIHMINNNVNTSFTF